MPFETYTVPTYKIGHKDIGATVLPKTAEEFSSDITDIYERVQALSGQVVSHTVVRLEIDTAAADEKYSLVYGIEMPQEHAVIVAELPETRYPHSYAETVANSSATS